jgi:8-oxo-dGTP pyrophosphatase MutT (NUDIX family)
MPSLARWNDRRATHGGGVVYRLTDSAPELLLVTTRFDQSVWVLPKGHIEAGESSGQTAVREVFEEAGVMARIVEFLTRSRQVARGRAQHIDYYLLEMVAVQSPPEEDRRIAWLAQDAAIRRITYDESRDVLIQACARLAESRRLP